MAVLTFVARFDLHRRVEKALGSQFVMDDVASAKECLQMARLAPYEGVLIDSDSLIFVDVLALVKLLRHESSDTSIFIFSAALIWHNVCLCSKLGWTTACVSHSLPRRWQCASVYLYGCVGRRRIGGIRPDVLRSGDLELDLVRRTAARSGKAIDLRPKEFLLLEYLVRNVNRPVTRAMILEHVWKSSFEGLTNVVDVHIGALRCKVDRDFPQKLIQTNRGIGTPSLAATRRSSCTRLSCSLAQSAAASTAKQHHSIGNHRQLPTFTDPGDNPGDRQNVSATMTRRSAAPSRAVIVSVTVGTVIANRPLYRSVRAELPHTAPTLDEWRRKRTLGKGCRVRGRGIHRSKVGLRPSLRWLRGSLTFSVRQLHRYYGAVRILQNVHARIMGLSPSRTGLLAQTFWRSSRFSCTLFADVPGLFDYAGPSRDSHLTRLADVAFPLTEKGRHPVACFRSSMFLPASPLSTLRYDPSRDHRQDSRPEWSRFSFSGRSRDHDCS